MNDSKYLSVGAINRYLKSRFDNDPNLQKVFIKGEISNFKRHTTGHLYFSIKDETGKINAIMFRTQANKVLFEPMDGSKVLITGRVSVYEATGSYQIYVDEMLEDGVGNLYLAFEKLKRELAKEGLFDEAKKKKIPKIPETIGVITAPTGAAIKDILSTIKRRFPLTKVYLFSALVQGDQAASDIVKKIKQANTYPLDVLIVGRGGGSIEDLWPFNEEIVARAIYESKIPVISAVGHEIDFTISDFVADLRAPTPTGAAEMAVPNINDVINNIEQLKIRLNESIYKKINYQKLYLDSLKNSYVIKNPMIMYEQQKQKIDVMQEKIKTLILHKLDNNKTRLNNLKNSYIMINPENLYANQKKELVNIIAKLELLNPLKVLKRGYTITYKDNHVMNSINDINTGDKLELQFVDGKIKTIVESKENN